MQRHEHPYSQVPAQSDHRGSSESRLRSLFSMLILHQIIPASYQNEAKLIEIRDLDPAMIPGSPEDIRLPVPPR